MPPKRPAPPTVRREGPPKKRQERARSRKRTRVPEIRRVAPRAKRRSLPPSRKRRRAPVREGLARKYRRDFELLVAAGQALLQPDIQPPPLEEGAEPPPLQQPPPPEQIADAMIRRLAITAQHYYELDPRHEDLHGIQIEEGPAQPVPPMMAAEEPPQRLPVVEEPPDENEVPRRQVPRLADLLRDPNANQAHLFILAAAMLRAWYDYVGANLPPQMLPAPPPGPLVVRNMGMEIIRIEEVLDEAEDEIMEEAVQEIDQDEIMGPFFQQPEPEPQRLPDVMDRDDTEVPPEYGEGPMEDVQVERGLGGIMDTGQFDPLQRRVRALGRLRENQLFQEIIDRIGALPLDPQQGADFRNQVTLITRRLEFADPIDVVRGRVRLNNVQNELQRRYNEAQDQGQLGLAREYGDMFEWFRNERQRFDTRVQELYPKLLDGKTVESDSEFMTRMQRTQKELARAVQSNNEDETLLLTAQLRENEQRYQQIEQTVLNTDLEAYANRVLEENTNAIVLPENQAVFNDMRAEYDSLRKDIGRIAKAIERERDATEPNLAKLAKLGEEWDAATTLLDRRKPVFQEAKAGFEQARAQDRDRFVEFMRGPLRDELDELEVLLFQPYVEGEIYYPIPDLDTLVKEFIKTREILFKYYDEEFQIDQSNWEDAETIQADVAKLRNHIATEVQRLQEGGKGLREPNAIMRDLDQKYKLLQGVVKQSGKGSREIPAFESRLVGNLETSERILAAEHVTKNIYEVLTKEFPGSWNDAVRQLEAEISDLRRRATQDVSAFGPYLSTVTDQIWNRFVQRIQNVSATERQRFDFAIEAEKKYLYDTISSETSARLGLTFENRTQEVKEFLFDPSTFAKRHQEGQEVMKNTNLGNYLSETRRLMDLLRKQMELRMRMVYEPYMIMGTEGAFDATKFDLILTHLYPPSQLELKLRYLMSLPDRDSYGNTPFILAIKQLDPDFDIKSLNYENLLQRSTELGQRARSFLQQKVGMTPIAWGDFENMADQFTRLTTTILTQTAPPKDDTAVERGLEGFGPQAPPSEQIQDQDAGAILNESGYRVNPTFNPSTPGQVTRDKIDDAKRQTYLETIGPITSMLLGSSQKDETYVPMHPGAAKFYFATENYDSLSSQYETMKPLIPKKPLKDPNGVIESVIAEYGPMLGIRERKSRPQDHPVFVQKEALELQELVQGYKNYTSRSAGNFEHIPDQNPQPAPALQTDPTNPDENTTPKLPSEPSKKKENNPEDQGESRTEPIMKGLRSAYLDDMVANLHKPFSNPFQ